MNSGLSGPHAHPHLQHRPPSAPGPFKTTRWSTLELQDHPSAVGQEGNKPRAQGAQEQQHSPRGLLQPAGHSGGASSSADQGPAGEEGAGAGWWRARTQSLLGKSCHLSPRATKTQGLGREKHGEAALVQNRRWNRVQTLGPWKGH